MRARRSAPAARVLDAARTRAVALELLARRPWTRRELGARLRRRGAPAEVAEAVVADLVARGYVDDRAFATAWAETRARGRGYGSLRLRAELRRKGVARPLAEAAIERAFVETDELARARAVAERRLPALRKRAPERAAPRLHAHLLRRGFPAEVADRVVRQLCAARGQEP